MYDVITVGSSTVDVFAKTKFSELIKIIGPKGETDLLAYPTGSKILVKELEFATGGGATNTAVALARLGNKVAWLGKLGNDDNANIIIEKLKKEKVDILAKKSKGVTGYSVILDSIEHDRTILAYKGVNNDFDVKDIPFGNLKTKWFYFSAMLKKAFDTQIKLAQFAEQNKIKIAFNPSSYLAEKGVNYLKDILSRTDILVLNREEASALVKGEGNDIQELLRKTKGVIKGIVVITDGKKGVYAFDGTHMYKVFPCKVKVVETTGAGDAFAASFLAGMIKRNDIEFSLKLGIENAASAIQEVGAKNGLLTWSQALKRVKANKKKIIKTRI